MRQFPKSVLAQFPKEFAVFKRLRTPGDIQDFINTIPINFETKGETYYSPLMVLKNNKAHCMEGAVLAAAALWYQGRPPFIFDLKTSDDDTDHVVALFKEGDRWGAISKTNHAVLRYRDPIYKSLRELVMSLFHEYFLDTGVKTLRSYSAKPFDLSKLSDDWLTSPKDLWDIVEALDDAPHVDILEKGTARRLRLAESIEIEAGKIVGETLERRSK